MITCGISRNSNFTNSGHFRQDLRYMFDMSPVQYFAVGVDSTDFQ